MQTVRHNSNSNNNNDKVGKPPDTHRDGRRRFVPRSAKILRLLTIMALMVGSSGSSSSTAATTTTTTTTSASIFLSSCSLLNRTSSSTTSHPTMMKPSDSLTPIRSFNNCKNDCKNNSKDDKHNINNLQPLTRSLLLTRGGSGRERVKASRWKTLTNHSSGTNNKTKPPKHGGGLITGKTAAITQQRQEQQQQQQTNATNINLLIRILFLCYYGSLGSIMPYLPVYYDSLGHGGQIIGLLGAVKPATTFVVAPLWGIIADQTAQPFLILQVTFLVSLVGQLMTAVRDDARYIMFMVFLTALFNAPVKSLLDSMVLDHIPDRSSYGRLRLWGQLGFGIGSSVVGFILSKSKHVAWPDDSNNALEEVMIDWPLLVKQLIRFAEKFWRSLTGYKLLFFSYAALSIPTWGCIQTFRRLSNNDHQQHDGVLSDETSALSSSTKMITKRRAGGAGTTNVSPNESNRSRILEGLNLLIHDADVLLFFLLVLIVGISSGVIENFAYVRMREVGGTGKEMGLSRLVSSVAGAPMFWFSGSVSQALGADRVLVLSLLSYVVRFVIYAGMGNAYHGLPAEALRGVSFAAFWSTSTIYAHRVSPPGLHATMLIFLNAMYGGLGQSLGAIIGGKLQHRYGTVRTFLYSAAVDMVFVGLIIVYLTLRKDSSFRDKKILLKDGSSITSSQDGLKGKKDG